MMMGDSSSCCCCCLARLLFPPLPRIRDARSPAQRWPARADERETRQCSTALLWSLKSKMSVLPPLSPVPLSPPPPLPREHSTPHHFFLLATVLALPFRVRAFVLVRWPRHGKLAMWRRPRYEPISLSRLMLSAVKRRRSPSVVYFSTSSRRVVSSASDNSRVRLFSMP